MNYCKRYAKRLKDTRKYLQFLCYVKCFSFYNHYMNSLFIVIIIVVIFTTLIISLFSSDSDFHLFESGARRAGRRGEELAREYIKSVLQEGDTLLNNIKLEYDGKTCECDNVVVNKFGVFIIEVKYYEGKLSGNIDDYEWTKTKITDADNVYETSVKNPIKQVNRQVYILAKYLEENGIYVWVDGYAMILWNHQIVHNQILNSIEDIDKAIHTKNKENHNGLSTKKQTEIINVLTINKTLYIHH